MLEKRKKLLSFVKNFVEICNRESIWYSLDRHTLKGSQKHGGFVPWEERFEVMLTINSYKKLKRVCSSNIVDSFLDKKYKLLSPAFVANNKDWVSPQPFISIRLLVPTTTKKLKRFFSPLLRFKNLLYLRLGNIRNAINELIERDDYEGYFLLERKRSFARQNWIQALSLQTKIVTFSGIKVKVIKEYVVILKYWFGDNYLEKTSIPQIWYNYTSPFLKERETN